MVEELLSYGEETLTIYQVKQVRKFILTLGYLFTLYLYQTFTYKPS